MTKTFGRRPLLLTLRGAVVGLPFMTSLRSARLVAAPTQNLVAIMMPNGVLKRKWMPEGDGTNVVLGESFAPIAHLKDRLTLFREIDNVIPAGAAADNHRQSIGLWTGGLRKADLSAGGPSFDTFIASKLATSSGEDVLRLGIQSPGAVGVSAPSYAMDGKPKLGNNSSRAVFEQLFGKAPGGSPMADPLKTSILDDIKSDYQAVAKRVNAADRTRLEAHLESIRQVELRMSQLPKSCATPGVAADWPTHGGGYDSYSDPQLTQAVMVSQFDLAALALSCGKTRVVAIMMLQEGEGGSSSNYPWLDPSLANHHGASHAQKDVLALADRYNLERTAQLIKKLDELGLGAGTLVVQGSGLSNGAAHNSIDLPIVMVGDAGGRLKTGRIVRGGKRAYNDVILTVLHAFGLPEKTFGEAARCKGPFTELLV